MLPLLIRTCGRLDVKSKKCSGSISANCWASHWWTRNFKAPGAAFAASFQPPEAPISTARSKCGVADSRTYSMLTAPDRLAADGHPHLPLGRYRLAASRLNRGG